MAKVYISSTFTDLRAHREAVYKILRKLEHDVISIEDYVAADQRPLAKCLEDVGTCAVYVGIFAWRYGHIPAQENPQRKSMFSQTLRGEYFLFLGRVGVYGDDHLRSQRLQRRVAEIKAGERKELLDPRSP